MVCNRRLVTLEVAFNEFEIGCHRTYFAVWQQNLNFKMREESKLTLLEMKYFKKIIVKTISKILSERDVGVGFPWIQWYSIKKTGN